MNTYIFTYTVEVDAEDEEEAWDNFMDILERDEGMGNEILNGEGWWIEEEILDIDND